jgi:3-oxoacyl-[acyl-carrier protein] reductase
MLRIDLSGHTALVTGAGGQLGRVMVRVLAGCGADVAVHYHRRREVAEGLVAEAAALGVHAALVQADVTDAASVEAMRAEVARTLGVVDIVVANAVAQIDPWATVLEEEPDDYLSQFTTCVMQSVLLAKAFVPAMRERRWGRYVAVNTECAMEAAASSSAYVAGKRGLDGVMRVLAREVGPYGITVNQVAPGDTVSDRDREGAPPPKPEYMRTLPLGRRGTDLEVAQVVAFLASDLASFVTGAFVPVCGGRVMPAI